jgi:hypothetical protein
LQIADAGGMQIQLKLPKQLQSWQLRLPTAVRLFTKRLGEQKWQDVSLRAIVVVKMNHISLDPCLVGISRVVKKHCGPFPYPLWEVAKQINFYKRPHFKRAHNSKKKRQVYHGTWGILAAAGVGFALGIPR